MAAACAGSFDESPDSTPSLEVGSSRWRSGIENLSGLDIDDLNLAIAKRSHLNGTGLRELLRRLLNILLRHAIASKLCQRRILIHA